MTPPNPGSTRRTGVRKAHFLKISHKRTLWKLSSTSCTSVLLSCRDAHPRYYVGMEALR